MRFETEFSIDQHVWRVGRQRKQEMIVCPTCEGAGKLRDITGMDGRPYDLPCPNEACRRGRVSDTYFEAYEVYDEAIVGSVEVRARKQASGLFQPEYEENYMVDKTGIGSGTIYPKRDGVWSHVRLFASQIEAEAFCEDENVKLRKETERVDDRRPLAEREETSDV